MKQLFPFEYFYKNYYFNVHLFTDKEVLDIDKSLRYIRIKLNDNLNVIAFSDYMYTLEYEDYINKQYINDNLIPMIMAFISFKRVMYMIEHKLLKVTTENLFKSHRNLLYYTNLELDKEYYTDKVRSDFNINKAKIIDEIIDNN